MNFSKRGVSTTIGVRGASVNIGKRGTYLNTGIPGTGLYNRRKLSDAQQSPDSRHHPSEAAEQTSSNDHRDPRKYKHRLWPWWVFGTLGVALLRSPEAIQAYWAVLVLVWLLRPIVRHLRARTPEAVSAPTDSLVE